MKPYIPHAIAAALAAGAVGIAFAQTQTAPTFVKESVASLSRTEGTDVEIAKQMAGEAIVVNAILDSQT